LKSTDSEKTAKSIDYLGCSVEEYKKYISSLFQDGMSWENHGNGDGEWHIHHIRPCASFNNISEDDNEKKMCFHYSNHEPKWGHENLSLGSKFCEEEHPLKWNGREWIPK
tara:strand:+ start:366 stop:695 length:330 start_codon:yes stop_codon:yes gene_type:complete